MPRESVPKSRREVRPATARRVASQSSTSPATASGEAYLLKFEFSGPFSLPGEVVVGCLLDIHVNCLEGQVEGEGIGGVVLVDDLHGLPGVQVRGELVAVLVTLLEAGIEVVGLAAAHLAHPVSAVVSQLPAKRSGFLPIVVVSDMVVLAKEGVEAPVW